MKYLKLVVGVLCAAWIAGAVPSLAFADTGTSWRGMGHGMMGGGYGPGYGMMGGGYGPGYGMMGGGYGIGPGMEGYGSYRDLGLSAEQQSRMSQIRKAAREKQWPLMSEMMDAQEKLQDLYDADKPDETAINKQYKVLEDLRRKMVDNSLETSKKMEELLTKEQREKLRCSGGRGYRHHMMW